MSKSQTPSRRQARRRSQPDAASNPRDPSMAATGGIPPLNHRHVASALLVSAVLTLAAGGVDPHDGSTTGQPARPADPEAAWQVYYEATHPAFGRVGPRGGSDPEAAWQEYYELTHPDPGHDGS